MVKEVHLAWVTIFYINNICFTLKKKLKKKIPAANPLELLKPNGVPSAKNENLTIEMQDRGEKIIFFPILAETKSTLHIDYTVTVHMVMRFLSI